MSSPVSTSPLQEIWLILPDGTVEQVDECGIRPAEDAMEQSHALWTWLYHGKFDHGVLHDDTDRLLTLHRELRGRGVDPRKCRVVARDFGAVNTCGRAAEMAAGHPALA